MCPRILFLSCDEKKIDFVEIRYLVIFAVLWNFSSVFLYYLVNCWEIRKTIYLIMHQLDRSGSRMEKKNKWMAEAVEIVLTDGQKK